MKKSIFWTLVVLTGFSLMNCTGRDETNLVKESNPSNKVSLVSNKISNNLNNRVNVIIFSVNIGRASQGCLRGWGFCNFEWFPLINPDAPLPTDKLLVEEKISTQNERFFEIQAGSPVPGDVTAQELELIVDSDMTTQVNGTNVTLKKGTYHYDYSIGQYGGYRVTLN